MMNERNKLAVVVAAALGVVFAGAGVSVAETGDAVLINEVLGSHTGTDDTEYVELFGTAGESLDGLSLIIVESDDISTNGRIDRRVDFDDTHALRDDGFFLIGNPAGLAENYGVVPDFEIAANFVENSSYTIALVETDSISGSDVTGGEVVLDSVGVTDGGATDSFFFDAPVVGPDGSFLPAGVRRAADGVDTDTVGDWVFGDFGLGADNTPNGEPVPPPPFVTIMDIQGDGQRSDWEDERVETTGIVTLFTANGANFWLQDPEGDDDSTTSDGIFVAGGGFPASGERPEVGDEITIIATVDEQQFGNGLPLTRLVGVGELEILSTNNVLPKPVELEGLPGDDLEEGIAFWEKLEGMLVEVKDPYAVSATSRFGEFAVVAKKDRKKGSGYSKKTKQLLIGSSTPNVVDYNPERILVDDSSLEDALEVLPGTKFKTLIGCVDYTFGNFKLQPAEVDFKAKKLPKTPVAKRKKPKKDQLVVTSFNVENLFDLIDNPDKDDGGSTPTEEELDTKLTKLAMAIEDELRLPQIICVQEVENEAILQTLGDRVNDAAGTDYVAVSFETSDGRGIECGFLYDSDRVTKKDAFQMSGEDVEDAFGPDSASPGREPIVGVFEFDEHEFTIVNNHFKSKGGDDPLFGVNQPPVRVTETQRKAQAQAVRNFVNDLFEDDEDALVIVTGDLNDFEFGEPGEGADHPLAILAGTEDEVALHNLVEDIKKDERFSFVFDGNSQVLDHMLVSPAFEDLVRDEDFLHFNAGFPASLSGDETTTLRASDHDPLEARFRFDKKKKK